AEHPGAAQARPMQKMAATARRNRAGFTAQTITAARALRFGGLFLTPEPRFSGSGPTRRAGPDHGTGPSRRASNLLWMRPDGPRTITRQDGRFARGLGESHVRQVKD